jgi:hypothetical protein
MRRWATWLVLAALAAIGVAAVVDSLPSVPDADEPARRVSAHPTAAQGADVVARLPGTLYYTTETCRLQAIRLRAMKAVVAPEWDDCSFSLSRDGRAVGISAFLWQPRGRLQTLAVDGDVYVSGPGSWKHRFDGASAPAFKPDGMLTFVRDGDVVAWTTECSPGAERVMFREDSKPALRCPRVVLTTGDLAGPLRFDPDVPRDPGAIDRMRVTEIAWLTDARLVAVVALELRDVGREDLLAIYEGRRLVRTVPAHGGRFTGLQVSPRGGYVAARLDRPGGFVFIDRTGRPFSLAEVRRDFPGRRPFTAGRALAWSPDQRWAAVARRRSVFVFSLTTEGPNVIKLPLEVRDLAWR